MARNRHAAMSDLSLLSGVERKSQFGAVRSAFDPFRKWGRYPYSAAASFWNL